MARWQDWFPSAHHASDAFFAMRASRITSFGQVARSDTWEDIEYLNAVSCSFAPADPSAPQAVFLNAGLLGQTPYWLRKDLLARLDNEAHPVAVRGRGRAGSPRVPSRFLGLGSVPAIARHIPNVRAVGYADRTNRSLNSVRYSAGEARRLCSVALIGITQGNRSPQNVLAEAAKNEHHPYRSIALTQLLMAQPRVGLVSAERQLDRLAAFLGQARPQEDETVAWLLDDRAARRRLLAWQEVTRPKLTERGFPWR